MATGGVFQLISNDGKQDRMIMATEMLRNRLQAISAKRKAENLDDTPTLLDIERTHVLFTNAHFKPFVAIGFEYNKVNSAAGSVQLGSEVQFSIPQFGDFFNDMVLYVKLDKPDVVLPSGVSAAQTPTVRWCDYPGERLIRQVRFVVNGNPLDSYSTNVNVLHRNFSVQPNKELSWKRCVGQEVPVDGFLKEDSSLAPANSRVAIKVANGAQTPKSPSDVEGLTLMIPLLFWCNKDPRLAVPSVSIPFGQRYIYVDLASKDEMVGVQSRGLSPNAPANWTLNAPSISQMALYINNIFVNPEIHTIFIKRIGFSLIRVHREQVISTTLNSNNVLLNNMKWPIETLFVGMRPTAQKSSLAHWHRFTSVQQEEIELPNTVSTETTASVNNGAVSFVFKPVVAEVEKSVKTLDRITVSAHSIKIYADMPADFFSNYTTYTYGGHNVRAPADEGLLMIPFNLYPGTYQPSGHFNVSRAREFYIEYISSVIGSTVTTGSGASAVSSVVSGELVVVASAINFLLISDGSAVLRYST
jgi:hypothetical protein